MVVLNFFLCVHFIYHGENNLHSIRWYPLCTRPTCLVGFLVLAHINSHSTQETLSRFPTNLSTCWTDKQQIPILVFSSTIDTNFEREPSTFNNISAISWPPVLVVEEARVPGENHRPWVNNWKTISCGCESSAPFFVIYKAGRKPMLYWR